MSKRNIKKSGSGATEDLPTCSYFRQLTFLSDSIGNCPTISNVPSSISNIPPSPTQSPPMVVNYSKMQKLSFPNTTTTTTAYRQVPNAVTKSPVSISTASINPCSSVKDKRREKRKDNTSTVDMLLAQSLMEDMKRTEIPVQPKDDDSPDELFCRSMVPYFKNISGKNNMMAKIKVMEILLEFSEDD